MYLALHILHPQEFLVPTYDIDIVWHTHQVRTAGNTLLRNRQALLEIFAISAKFTVVKMSGTPAKFTVVERSGKPASFTLAERYGKPA
jgi:hypothetical protein